MKNKLEKKPNTFENYTRLSGYSLIVSLLAFAAYIFLFPNGIYYGFVFGVVGVAGGLLSRPYSLKRGTSTAAIVFGVLVTAVSFMSFRGLSMIYSSVNDPVAGPQMTRFITELLQSYNIPLDTFASMMRP